MGSLSNSALSSIFALAIPLSDKEDVKPSLTGSEFIGTWVAKDSYGVPFEIELTDNGAAHADRDGEGMAGTWETDGPSAVIAWDTGWTTKITRTGESYVKTAYDAASATPANTSPAEKVH